MPPSVRAAAMALAGTWPRRAAWLVLAAAVLVTALIGGFETASAPAPARVAPGDAVDVGPVRLAAQAWTIRDDIATSSLQDAGAAGWLVIEAEVTALTDATTTFPDTALRLPPELRLDGAPDRVLLLAGGTFAPQLQPGLPARVALLWPVADGVDPGDELALTYLRSRRSDSTIDAGQMWRPGGVAAHTALPRDDSAGDAIAEDPEDEL
ncbi:hypothetical protein E1262_26500 [Jiangella aurantiaca]|uniref:Uncharacterized protein n=1 Tax=Jiangella aurantiaca TaxID=2530373 RepID=A0A4R5A5Y9_9ACTN|nr:hypothetical protein [Jiangella aurantiaca]TDD65002.1 hypothetical protein E1262_26500 [Jiangella aurantiaca]